MWTHRFSLVIFDLDGTLVVMKFDAMAAKKAMIQELTRMGLDTSDLAPEDSTKKILERAESLARSPSLREGADAMDSLTRILDDFETSAAQESELRDGILDVLTALRDSGISMAIVTNSGRRALSLTLQRHDLAPFFSALVTRNDVTKIKPDGEGLLKAIRMAGSNGDATVYVGDSWIDIRAAKNAGIPSAALLGGFHGRERLLTESPDHLLESVTDILKLVSIG